MLLFTVRTHENVLSGSRSSAVADGIERLALMTRPSVFCKVFGSVIVKDLLNRFHENTPWMTTHTISCE
jgi:hypothetical protein